MTSTDMRAPAVNERGLALIKRFEGFRAVAYRDPGGVFTIGYGHTSAAGDPAIHPGLTITGEEGERILARDVAHFAAKVAGLVRVPLNGDQFSALVSFAYNVGIENFRTSSVLKAVNARDFEAVPRRLALWVKAGGRVLPGLVARRAAEGELFAKDGLEPSDTDPRSPDESISGKSPWASTTNWAAAIGALSAVTANYSGRDIAWALGIIALAAAMWIVRERLMKSREDGV